jgi:hypothetical protein
MEDQRREDSMMETKFNWRGLFAGDPAHVHVAQSTNGRVFGSDRYAIWNLSAVCEAEGMEVPSPGPYRAMSKALQPLPVPTHYVPLNGGKIAALFDSYTEGIESDPADRLMVSQWSNGTYRPIIHSRTADVRMIGTQWDNIPRLGRGSYWVACANWATVNVAVHWNMAAQIPLGAVQLIGSSLAGAKDGSDVWNMWNHDLARGVIAEEGGMPWEVVDRRYPR